MVEYKRGRENKATNALSRVSNNKTNAEDAKTAEEINGEAKAGEETDIGYASTPIDNNVELTDQTNTVQKIRFAGNKHNHGRLVRGA